jgi:Outer membrane protein beta-barrel domain
MRFYFPILTLFVFFGAFAQEEVVEKKAVVDSLYREDQFYLNFTYNKLQNLKGLRQNKFSSGFSIGFLRDMPINKNRTFAVAVGLGYSLNILNDNLYISKPYGGETYNYQFISSDVYYDKNKLSLHYIDLPIEFRWRASTPESHIFWRLYTGFKMSYLVNDRYKFANDIQTVIYKGNTDFNKLQYGCYLAAGWNTWNFYAYYGLSPIFKSAVINGESTKMNTFNIGLQFYIL